MAGRISYYGGIVKDGLVLDLDAAKKDSYPGSGTVWNDISNYQNNISLINTPTYATTNRGLVFDGSTQYASIAGTENQITSSAVTVEIVCSIKSNTFTSTTIGNPNTQYIVFRQNTRTSNFEGYVISYIIGSGTDPGIFYAVCTSSTGTQRVVQSSTISGFNIPIVVSATYDSSFVKLYINGSFISQATTGFALNYNTNQKLTLGRANPTGTIFDGYFNGTIYNYKQYNRVLSADEIAQNYNALKSRFGL
jgi:hypothetical protein